MPLMRCGIFLHRAIEATSYFELEPDNVVSFEHVHDSIDSLFRISAYPSISCPSLHAVDWLGKVSIFKYLTIFEFLDL